MRGNNIGKNCMGTLACWAVLVLQATRCFSQGTIEYGPYVSQVTTSSIAITWITNRETSDNKVLWGIDSPAEEAMEDSTEKNPHLELWSHVVFLTGLSANTEYVYKVVSDDSESLEFPVRSAVDWGEPFSFGFGADNQGSPDHLADQFEEGLQSGLHFYVFASDLIGNASRLIAGGHGWEDNLFIPGNTYPNEYGTSGNFMASHAVYNAVGWHDLGFEEGNSPLGCDHFPFFWTFPTNGLEPDDVTFEHSDNRYQKENYRQEYTYAFGYGNTYFICISDDWPGGVAAEDQADWVRKHLEIGKRDYAFRIVFSHCCKFGTNSGDNRPWEDMLPEYGVTAHLHGHKHEYQYDDNDGVAHITGPTSNKGDYGRMVFDGEKMRFSAHNSNGGLLGKATYDPDPDVDPPMKTVPVKQTENITISRTGNALHLSISGNVPDAEAFVYDIIGTRIATLKAARTIVWDLSGVEKGMYFVTLGKQRITLPVY